jgi:UDP-N-acetylglucosamine--N-acetylmuramyl-(pentapeptide) pyrophosphoryl-undecaprenol N-acetylglucosamine transferase
MHVLLAGGGTGGHLFPGIAIAEEVRARDAANRVLFVGTARGIEARICPRDGWPLELIAASGLKTVGRLGALRGLLRLPWAGWQSHRIIQRFQPDVVIGVGGYASGPVLAAAALADRPTAILEPNSVPGLANRVAARFVKQVFIAFAETGERLDADDKIMMTGNPIRAALRDQLGAAAAVRREGLPHLLCFGGSLGATAVNALFADACRLLIGRGLRFTALHQTGEADLEATRARHGEGSPVTCTAFIDDMATAYADADLVLARAGATTVAELTVVGRAAVLFPYPTAADDHQTVNARALADAGAALVLTQQGLTAERLAEVLAELIGDASRRQAMAAAMRSLGRPDAAATIVDWIETQLVSSASGAQLTSPGATPPSETAS